jgi:DNA polymerase IV
VRLDDWTNITRDRSIDEYTNDTVRVTEIALDLLDQNRPARPVRLIGVRVASFEGAAPERPAPIDGADGPVQLVLPVGEGRPA